MQTRIAILLAASLALASGAAAQDVKTPLGCKLGAAAGSDRMLDVANSTKTTYKKETIVNLAVTTTGTIPGEDDQCFVLDAPFAPGAHLSRKVTVHVAGTPSDCKAYVSSKIPAVVHNPDGSTMTQCDS